MRLSKVSKKLIKLEIFSGVINMKTMTERDHNFLLEQYAFSNAIGSSVKLGMLEAR